MEPPFLVLPTTFEVEDPDGYYRTVIFARLEKTAENAYRENAHRAQLRPLAAGGIEPADAAGAQESPPPPPGGGAGGRSGPGGGTKVGGGKAKLPKPLLGALTSAEVSESVKQGPTDAKGKPKCWDAACHDGCTKTATTCPRSHAEGIRNSEKIHWTVKAQFIKRGGLRSGPKIKVEDRLPKIQSLRADALKEQAPTAQDAPKAQEGTGPADPPSGRRAAGCYGSPVPPERGPSLPSRGAKDVGGRPTGRQSEDEERDPLAAMARDSEEAMRVAQATARLRAYCHGRLLEGHLGGPVTPIEEILRDAVALGDEEMAAQARPYLGTRERRTGGEAAVPEVQVGEVVWGTRDEPGRGLVHIKGRVWEVRDYQDGLPITEELAGRLPGCQVGAAEDRQCVFINTAAAYLQKKSGTDPSAQEVVGLAQTWRAAMWEEAKRAEAAMGTPDAYISPTESDVRMFCHDVLHVGHDKDYRALAAFPPAALRRTAVHVVRVDPWGRAQLEVIVGTEHALGDGALDVWMLLDKGRLQVLVAPDVCGETLRSDFADRHPLQEVAAAGWAVYLNNAAGEEARVPGDVAQRCPKCRAAQQAGLERKAGERATQGEDPSWRPLGRWGCTRWRHRAERKADAPQRDGSAPHAGAGPEEPHAGESDPGGGGGRAPLPPSTLSMGWRNPPSS